MSKEVSRLAFIDALKAIASQLIVLHHLAFYGPLSDAAHRAAPEFFGWLASDARIAVQVFLVIGGFLAARSLAPSGILRAAPGFLLQAKKRYLKLVIPFLGAVIASILLSAIARQLFVDEAIPAAPNLTQVLSHALLLHGVLGIDSLSAGVWYVAIDFQLFLLLLSLLWVSQRFAGRQAHVAGALLVSAFATASLLFFNRISDWDNWAVYFFGAYGLGVLTCWLAGRKQSFAGWGILAAIAVAALLLDFRSRILVALLTALALGIASRWRFLESWPQGKVFAWLGRISYSVFLIHFPLILVVNGLFLRIAPTDPTSVLLIAGFAWACSVLAGDLFYRHVESRAGDWQAWVAGILSGLRARKPATLNDRG